jgi:hypothetical protein
VGFSETGEVVAVGKSTPPTPAYPNILNSCGLSLFRNPGRFVVEDLISL